MQFLQADIPRSVVLLYQMVLQPVDELAYSALQVGKLLVQIKMDMVRRSCSSC